MVIQNPDTLPGAWPGLQLANGGGVMVANGSPEMVPVVSGTGAQTTTTSTSTTPTLTVGSVTSSIGTAVQDAIAHPTQHIFLIVIVALILWFLSKHVK